MKGIKLTPPPGKTASKKSSLIRVKLRILKLAFSHVTTVPTMRFVQSYEMVHEKSPHSSQTTKAFRNIHLIVL